MNWLSWLWGRPDRPLPDTPLDRMHALSDQVMTDSVTLRAVTDRLRATIDEIDGSASAD